MGKLKPHDPLEAVRKNPLKVESFLLNPAHLRNQGFDCPAVMAFPRELLACTNMKRLELFRSTGCITSHLAGSFRRFRRSRFEPAGEPATDFGGRGS